MTEHGAHESASEIPDLRQHLDAARAQCPVSHDGDTWSFLGHAEVVAAATDPATYSSAVSRHRAIPNSLDGAEHGAFRRIVDRYMTPAIVASQEDQCRRHAERIVAGLARGTMVKTITDFGVPYAVRTQLEWLGWPAALEEELVSWMARNRAATRSGDYALTAAVAEEFDSIIRRLLAERDGSGSDVTSQLMRERVDGRLLDPEEIVSILRNWTAGDLGSLAASLGVVVHYLATHTEVQRELRRLDGAGEALAFEAAIEEILRIDDPFVSNRRVTTRDVAAAGVSIPAGSRVILNWTAANRDPAVFGDPDEFDPAGHAQTNLVFGIGPHVCPGRDLTLMELRVAVAALLHGTSAIDPYPHEQPVREQAPGSGWAQVPVVLRYDSPGAAPPSR